MYTIQDLEEAKAEQEKIAELWTKAYFHDEPNRYSHEAIAATLKLKTIDEDLKKRGIIPYSQHELIEEILDRDNPQAQSKEVPVHDGKRYRKKVRPLELSRTGKTVKRWSIYWEPLDGEL